MAYEKELKELSSESWGGLPHGEQRRTLLNVYTNLSKLADNYLDQNERTVLKALEKDNFDDEFKKILLDLEVSGHNRKKIVNALK